MILTGVGFALFYLIGLNESLNSGGNTTLNALLFTGMMCFFGSFLLIIFARFFSPVPRKWCRRLVWIMWIAGMMAFGASYMIYPWNHPDAM